IDGVEQGSLLTYTFTNITSNHTIRAMFVTDQLTITAFAGANGSISPSGDVSVAYGGSQSYSIAPNAGYNISDVVVDGASVGAVSSYAFNNVTAGHSIIASFTING